MWQFFRQFQSLEKQRQYLLDKVTDGPLKTYLSKPFPKENQQLKDIEILTLDFETTGLNAKHDQLLSIGFTTLKQGKINLQDCYHQVIKTKGKLDKSNVAVHQITDFEKDRGAELKLGLDNLLNAMAGKVVLVHFAQIERNFIKQACLEIYGIVPPLMMIDTLAICKKRMDMSDAAYDPSKLRLVNLREQYHLPGFYGHNALNDAIATAELLLAELNHQHDGIHTQLKSLL